MRLNNKLIYQENSELQPWSFGSTTNILCRLNKREVPVMLCPRSAYKPESCLLWDLDESLGEPGPTPPPPPHTWLWCCAGVSNTFPPDGNDVKSCRRDGLCLSDSVPWGRENTAEDNWTNGRGYAASLISKNRQSLVWAIGGLSISYPMTYWTDRWWPGGQEREAQLSLESAMLCDLRQFTCVPPLPLRSFCLWPSETETYT